MGRDLAVCTGRQFYIRRTDGIINPDTWNSRTKTPHTMAISTTDDPIIIEIVESFTTTVPGEEGLTQELKDRTVTMLGQCFEQRDRAVLEKATKLFT